MSEAASVGEDARVRLLVREPRRVFCFWDVGPGSLASLRRARGERGERLTRLGIRLLSDGRLAVDVVLPGAPAQGSGSRYLDVPLPGPTSAELGWVLPSGHFSALARSNSVEVPAARLSPEAAATRVRFPVDPRQLAALVSRSSGSEAWRGYGEIRVLRGVGSSDSFG
jgi:hypothetical protein